MRIFHLISTASRPERECPSRRYVFERHPRKKLKLPVSDIKEVRVLQMSWHKKPITKTNLIHICHLHLDYCGQSIRLRG